MNLMPSATEMSSLVISVSRTMIKKAGSWIGRGRDEHADPFLIVEPVLFAGDEADAARFFVRE